MHKFTYFTLMTATALVLVSCKLDRTGTPTPSSAVVRLTAQTQNKLTTFSQVGEVIHYEYVITNLGTTPLAGPVTVADHPRQVTCPELSTVGNQDNDLDLNETVICTAAYTVTEEDLQRGTITNLATATLGGVTSNSSGITLTRDPQPFSVLRLIKTASSQTYSAAGQSIIFTFNITNTGTTPLGPAQFMILDDKLGAHFSCGPENATLAPNQSLSCSASYIITSADMGLANITNSATASGAGQTSTPATVMITNLSPSGSQTPPGPVTPSSVIRITFDPGATTASQIGNLNSHEEIQYIFTAAQGQMLTINLTALADSVGMGINDPAGYVLKPLDTTPTWSATVMTGGDHTIHLTSLIDVSPVSYTLQVNLSPAIVITPGTIPATDQSGIASPTP
jgi:hypothetical protein